MFVLEFVMLSKEDLVVWFEEVANHLLKEKVAKKQGDTTHKRPNITLRIASSKQSSRRQFMEDLRDTYSQLTFALVGNISFSQFKKVVTRQ